jgi:NAD(P)H-flavin reductase
MDRKKRLNLFSTSGACLTASFRGRSARGSSQAIRQGTLVLVAGGAGWAPIWALACSARSGQRNREMIVVAGSRDVDNLYMLPALQRLIDDGVRDVIATTEIGATHPIKPGRPWHYLPLLGVEDTVYVAGPVGLVEIVKNKARLASAQCYADPFLPSAQTLSFRDKIARLWRS